MFSLKVCMNTSKRACPHLNWSTWCLLLEGHAFQEVLIHGISPMATLLLTCIMSPSQCDIAVETMLLYYGHETGMVPLQDTKLLTKYETYITPHLSADVNMGLDIAVTFWRQVFSKKSEDLNISSEGYVPCDRVPSRISYQYRWLVFKTEQEVFLWRRSERVIDPLLIDLLRELEEKIGLLPFWQPHGEGDLIQIPLKVLDMIVSSLRSLRNVEHVS